MKRQPKLIRIVPVYIEPGTTLWLQAPLPHFLHTLPILLSIEGQGSGRQGPSPLAPPEGPAND